MQLPIYIEDEPSVDKLTSDSNFNALSKKSAFKKAIKNANRDANFDEIIKECGGLPENNQVVFIKTNGCSDTGSIYTHIANNHDLDTLYLSTWIISRENLERICKDIDSGKLKMLYFVVSKRLKELKKSNYAFLIEQMEKRKDKMKIKVCNSHAKTFSVSTTDGNYFTVTGSGNWTENPRIENYVIFNDINAFNHNKEWMEEIINGR